MTVEVPLDHGYVTADAETSSSSMGQSGLSLSISPGPSDALPGRTGLGNGQTEHPADEQLFMMNHLSQLPKWNYQHYHETLADCVPHHRLDADDLDSQYTGTDTDTVSSLENYTIAVMSNISTARTWNKSSFGYTNAPKANIDNIKRSQFDESDDSSGSISRI